MKNLLRPISFDQFIGQTEIKNTLKILIKSASKTKEQVGHILFHGASGLGKTSLANIVAKAMKCNIAYVQGPMLEKKSDILTLLNSINRGDVIFIDEIHGINKNIEELMYSALEDGVIDITIGPEGDSKIVRMVLPTFTLIGATTKITKVSLPLKNRFNYIAKFMNYSDRDAELIIINSINLLKIALDQCAVTTIVNYSSNNPRAINHLLKLIKDFSIVKNIKKINKKFVIMVFNQIGLYKNGLNQQQFMFLKILYDSFQNKFISLENIAAIALETKQTIEVEIEPILLNLGYIEKSSRGRKITNHGINYVQTYNLI